MATIFVTTGRPTGLRLFHQLERLRQTVDEQPDESTPALAPERVEELKSSLNAATTKDELLAALRATLRLVRAVRDAAWAAGHDSPVRALDELLQIHSLPKKPAGRKIGRGRRS